MNFDHIIRFMALADGQVDAPRDGLLPVEKPSLVRMIPGDRLRFLLARSVLPKNQNLSNLTLRFADEGRSDLVMGRVRAQRAEQYAEMRIRVGRVPQPGEYCQFALITQTGKTVLRTFRWQPRQDAVSMLEYLNAIRQHYEAYPETVVQVELDGYDLVVRAEYSDRFQLGNEVLSIDLGQVLEQNTNAPQLTATRLLSNVSLPVQYQYTFVVGDDIEAGNVFRIGSTEYVATGSETPGDVLRALGLENGLTLETTTSLTFSAEVGTTTLANTNTPGIRLAYYSTATNDLYTTIVTDDVQEGNVYQVSASGMTTRVYVAVAGDTKATVEAFFNNTTGRTAIPIGAIPIATATGGQRSISNTNKPQLSILAQGVIPTRTVDRYLLTLGSSIKRGNRFVLNNREVIATEDDTVLTIAAQLTGNTQPVYPFTVDVVAGSVLTAYAEPGPRYSEEVIASVALVYGPVRHRNLPLVVDLEFPADELLYDYRPFQLHLCDGETPIAISTQFIRSSSAQTMLLECSDNGPTFGVIYAEPALVQRLRVPVFLKPADLYQQETVSRTLDNQLLRSQTTLQKRYQLTTTAEPASFHASLAALLKHSWLSLNGRPYVATETYQQGDLIGSKWLSQGETTLTEPSVQQNYSAFSAYFSDSASAGYVEIISIIAPPNLPIYLAHGELMQRIRPGSRLLPGAYTLLIDQNADEQDVLVYADDVLMLRASLTPNKRNRLAQPLIAEAGSRLSIRFILTTVVITENQEIINDGRSVSSEFNNTQFS